MQRREIESIAALHLPGGGALEIRRLRAGLAHETFKVMRDGRSYSLRVPSAQPLELGLDRAWEARVLERAAEAGLAPEPRFCEPKRGILVLDWIEGHEWSEPDAHRPACIERMADALRRLHALAIPSPARSVSPAQWIDFYTSAGAEAHASLRLAARSRGAELASLRGIETVLCHSDLHRLNVVDRGASLAFLDFEYAHVSDPLWDLASWSANNDFGEELALALATAYLGRPPTGPERVRIGLLAWLYDYVCLLWSDLYLKRAIRPAGKDEASTGSGTALGSGDAELEAIRSRACALRSRLEAGLR